MEIKMNNNDRLALAEWVIKQTLKYGADQAAVTISNSRGVEVEVPEKRKLKNFRNQLRTRLVCRYMLTRNLPVTQQAI
jgi:hypothetical protein